MSCNLKNCFAALPRTERGRSVQIGGDPKGKNFLYCIGNHVIIRNIENLAESDVYAQHALQTTVARYAPSGFYIASADTGGKIRIWDTTQREHLLKYEYQPHGAIYDLCWSPDSKRIITAGDGREKFASAFLWDSGSSVGTITGHHKPITCVDFKPSRPYKVATGGEDMQIAFHSGPPFKFDQKINSHSKFINTIKFSPNGEKFVSGGADGRAFLYNGKTAEKEGELGNPAHSGGIYGSAWKADSAQLITCSADKSVKLWDANTLELMGTINVGSKLLDQQLGCLWQGDHILSVSLSGYINYLDFSNSALTKVIKGHQKAITAITLSADKKKIYTVDYTGLTNIFSIV
ncbi:WD repeat-containing protein 1 [Trichoplax sp. H2]|nr:WD repeat-containing protein 1 [Trichoplax sp. H2]|eukprot:RDD39396.1 WD repeat-containing protein 1 [Trichoplax sp. H2]